MAAFRILWMAVVGLYDETFVLIAGNLAALALNLVIALIVRLAVLPLVGVEDETNTPFVIVLATLFTLIPTPGNLALAGLTQVAAGPDVPRFGAFSQTLRVRWGLALRCALVSLLVVGALVWNVTFYFSLGPGWPLFVTIFWLYATVFWLGMHIYVVPLAVHVAEPRLFDLYRRSALVAVTHPAFTFALLVLLLAISFASVIFLPVYVLLAQSLVSLAQAHALREIRRRHGDLVLEADAEEKIGRP